MARNAKKRFYLIVLILLILGGCTTSPDRKDYVLESCFSLDRCMYLNKDNHDKSACTTSDLDCSFDRKEKRIKDRVEYCRDSTPKGMSENECRLFLNQK